MIKIAVSGAYGKMGSKIINLALKDQNLKVVVGLEQKGHPQIGNSIKGIKISGNPEDIKDVDCLIEFTNPQASLEHLNYLLSYKKAGVIGTTGLDPQQVEKIKEACRSVPIVFSPNMSIGVNLLFKLVKETALKLSSNYKVSITEAHHIHKKDSPSGTALAIAEIVKEARGVEVSDTECCPEGHPPVGIRSIREGEIVGEHKVTFDSLLDTIELSHSAKTRDIFAQGALEAARWVVEQKAGLYSMEDVIG